MAILMTAGAAQGMQNSARFDLELLATVTMVVNSRASLADVNGDGKLHGLDLGLVARHLGTAPPSDPRADPDMNHVVDLALVVRHVRR